ncbi:phosphoglycerol transferase MdoB-like AlkP superfamily enzyme [Bradyrhizobium sp. USDA 4341]
MDGHSDLNQSHEIFVHIRIIVGMILGISVARLVTGVTRFIQHPGKERIDLLHLGWAVFVFLSIIHFWWFEFALSGIARWTFESYFLLICYSVVFVMLSAMAFPDNVGDHSGLSEYFWDHRNTFYGLILILLLVDVLDTLLKGSSYYHQVYGWYYPIRQGLLIGGTIGALISNSKRYHVLFVAFALVFQVAWIASLFDVIGSK